jgi:hypothetical protein
MNSIVIIGSNLVGLLTADILSKDNTVIIIEPDLELGFPANYPGRAENKKTVNEILSNEDKHNLFLLEIDGFANFRSEWFSKLLTHKLAKNNVDIMNRSRVSSINEIGKQLEVSIQGTEINNDKILCDTVIDFSESSFSIIGNSKHDYVSQSSKIIRPKLSTIQYFVGTCLLNDSYDLQNFEVKLQRNDDLVEVWFKIGQEEIPQHGWIESKTVHAYYESKLMLLEDYYSRAIELVGKMVI